METINIMHREEFLQKYWSYYLMLEKKLIATENFVSFDKNNFGAFSNEYASLLQLIGSELDVFFKEYCGLKLYNQSNISLYANSILNTNKEINQKVIAVNNKDLSLQPFENWDKAHPKKSLSWWQAFDNIKHNRIEHKKDANLKNVLEALSALFLLETMYMCKISDNYDEPDLPDEESSLFSLNGWKFKYLKSSPAFSSFIEEGFKALT